MPYRSTCPIRSAPSFLWWRNKMITYSFDLYLRKFGWNHMKYHLFKPSMPIQVIFNYNIKKYLKKWEISIVIWVGTSWGLCLRALRLYMALYVMLKHSSIIIRWLISSQVSVDISECNELQKDPEAYVYSTAHLSSTMWHIAVTIMRQI